MEIKEVNEIIKRGTAFKKSDYKNKDLAATLMVKFQNVKDANILKSVYNDKIQSMSAFGLINQITHRDTDLILTALKQYVRNKEIKH